MKHKFIAKLPKDVEFIGFDFMGREHYKKGNYRYMVNLENNTIERFML